MNASFMRRAAPWLAMVMVLGLAACATGLSADKQQQLNGLKQEAQHTLARLEQKLKDNPQSALEESLNVLDVILRYTDSVKTDPDRFSEAKMGEYLERIQIINENIERFNDLTLRTDVSFGLGEYKLLSAYARAESDKLVGKVLNSVHALTARYPGKRLKITFKVTGYTDQTDFSPGGPLEQRIRAHLGTAAPADAEARRILFNQVLAEFRARVVGEYLQAQMRSVLTDATEVELKIVGKGEALPQDAPAQVYQASDPRRRVCVISPFIEIVI